MSKYRESSDPGKLFSGNRECPIFIVGGKETKKYKSSNKD